MIRKRLFRFKWTIIIKLIEVAGKAFEKYQRRKLGDEEFERRQQLANKFMEQQLEMMETNDLVKELEEMDND